MDEMELRPCPFCGKAAEFERRGDRRQSCIVVCSECGARHESGDTWNSGSSWNRRAEPAMPDLSFLRTVTRAPVTESCPEGGSSAGVQYTEPLEFAFGGFTWRADGARCPDGHLIYKRVDQ